MCLLRDRQTRDSVRHMNFTDETLTSYLGRIPPPRVIKTESSQAEKQSEANGARIQRGRRGGRSTRAGEMEKGESKEVVERGSERRIRQDI